MNVFWIAFIILVTFVLAVGIGSVYLQFVDWVKNNFKSSGDYHD
jgi:hypothetical protein